MVSGAERVERTDGALSCYESIVLGGGCFWCMEAVFRQVPGVVDVVCGYAGGHLKNPTYKLVCTGQTGHAEVVLIRFDPQKISLEDLLAIFWVVHDPTTPDRQGSDVGPQYRSVIFYQDENQRRIAEVSRETAQKQFSRPIVTQIEPLKEFYPAEAYHQNFFEKNPKAPYCELVIRPKVEKVIKIIGLLGPTGKKDG